MSCFIRPPQTYALAVHSRLVNNLTVQCAVINPDEAVREFYGAVEFCNRAVKEFY
jgi:hypothetical protein